MADPGHGWTALDNVRVDGLAIDTVGDGINLGCCRNVRISGTTVNSPNADAIALKSSYALGEPRATENVTVDNCWSAATTSARCTTARSRQLRRMGGPGG